MDKFCEMFPLKVDKNVQAAAGILGGLAFSGYLLTKVNAKIRYSRARHRWSNAGVDVVVLHMFPRSKNVINMSPFPIKLETFLRANHIKYVEDFEYPMSSKGKSPWITLNGVEVSDSQLAMEHLCTVFNIDMNKHLSKQEVAISRSMRSLLEDHFYFTIVVEKWVYGRGRSTLDHNHVPGGWFGRFLMTIFLERVSKRMEVQTFMQGMGRHSLEDVRKMMKEDIRYFADFLENKKYLMGDIISEVDCVAFGFMALGKFAPITAENLVEVHPNINDYVERIKGELYPDWNELIKKK